MSKLVHMCLQSQEIITINDPLYCTLCCYSQLTVINRILLVHASTITLSGVAWFLCCLWFFYLFGLYRAPLARTDGLAHLGLREPVDSQEWWDSPDPKEPTWVFCSSGSLWMHSCRAVPQRSKLRDLLRFSSTGWTWKARREGSCGTSWSKSEHIFSVFYRLSNLSNRFILFCLCVTL